MLFEDGLFVGAFYESFLTPSGWLEEKCMYLKDLVGLKCVYPGWSGLKIMVREIKIKVSRLISELYRAATRSVNDRTRKWFSQTPNPPRILTMSYKRTLICQKGYHTLLTRLQPISKLQLSHLAGYYILDQFSHRNDEGENTHIRWTLKKTLHKYTT